MFPKLTTRLKQILFTFLKNMCAFNAVDPALTEKYDRLTSMACGLRKILWKTCRTMEMCYSIRCKIRLDLRIGYFGFLEGLRARSRCLNLRARRRDGHPIALTLYFFQAFIAASRSVPISKILIP